MRVLATTILVGVLVGVLAVGGCSGDGGSDGADTGTGVDAAVTPVTDVIVADGTGPETDTGAGPETSPPDGSDAAGSDTMGSACDQVCAAFAACDAAIVAACPHACADSEVATCETACLAEAADCEAAKACLGVPELPPLPFAEGPYGIDYRETAGPFTVPTLDGPFSFEETWTGRDGYVFTFSQTGLGYTEDLWASANFSWLYESPPNAHIFFVSYLEPGSGEDRAMERALAQKARVDEVLDKIATFSGKAAECHWRRRLHYVTSVVFDLGNWITEHQEFVLERYNTTTDKREPGLFGFTIDRFQKLRTLGMLNPFGLSDVPSMKHFRFELEHYDFEFEREQALQKEGVTEVVFVDKEHTRHVTQDVELPSAAEMATFDTLEIDVTQHCEGHDEGRCPDWDRIAAFFVRERPVIADNAYAATACQPEVKGQEAADEVMGTCPDGMTPCSDDAACGEGAACAGYSPELLQVDAIAADEQPCTCHVPGGGTRDTTHVCSAEGTGYGDCRCNEEVELVRWITTYWREGRWVMDASYALPLLSEGGTVRFRLDGGEPFVHSVSLRLFDAGKPDRAATLTPLWRGGGFNDSYNEGREPVVVPVPEGTKRAEVIAIITGHGQSSGANCAEFCEHTHHFFVGGQEYAQLQPWVGQNFGCTEQVKDGTVPNQWGTWIFGRAGWCPGMDVKPFVADVSSHLVSGGELQVSYEGWYQADPDAARPGGNIVMSSWLVTYE